jgi:hypothetical protein
MVSTWLLVGVSKTQTSTGWLQEKESINRLFFEEKYFSRCDFKTTTVTGASFGSPSKEQSDIVLPFGFVKSHFGRVPGKRELSPAQGKKILTLTPLTLLPE